MRKSVVIEYNYSVWNLPHQNMHKLSRGVFIMGFTIQRNDINTVLYALFPNDPAAFGFYAELNGFGTSFYIITSNGKEIALTYMGKIFMDPKDTVRYDISEVEIKVKAKLVAWAFDIKQPDGKKLKFVVPKRAMDFSEYQKYSMDRLKTFSR